MAILIRKWWSTGSCDTCGILDKPICRICPANIKQQCHSPVSEAADVGTLCKCTLQWNMISSHQICPLSLLTCKMCTVQMCVLWKVWRSNTLHPVFAAVSVHWSWSKMLLVTVLLYSCRLYKQNLPMTFVCWLRRGLARSCTSSGPALTPTITTMQVWLQWCWSPQGDTNGDSTSKNGWWMVMDQSKAREFSQSKNHHWPMPPLRR